MGRPPQAPSPSFPLCSNKATRTSKEKEAAAKRGLGGVLAGLDGLDQASAVTPTRSWTVLPWAQPLPAFVGNRLSWLTPCLRFGVENPNVVVVAPKRLFLSKRAAAGDNQLSTRKTTSRRAVLADELT